MRYEIIITPQINRIEPLPIAIPLYPLSHYDKKENQYSQRLSYHNLPKELRSVIDLITSPDPDSVLLGAVTGKGIVEDFFGDFKAFLLTCGYGWIGNGGEFAPYIDFADFIAQVAKDGRFAWGTTFSNTKATITNPRSKWVDVPNCALPEFVKLPALIGRDQQDSPPFDLSGLSRKERRRIKIKNGFLRVYPPSKKENHRYEIIGYF